MMPMIQMKLASVVFVCSRPAHRWDTKPGHLMKGLINRGRFVLATLRHCIQLGQVVAAFCVKRFGGLHLFIVS